jgi:hypothetical protein
VAAAQQLARADAPAGSLRSSACYWLKSTFEKEPLNSYYSLWARNPEQALHLRSPQRARGSARALGCAKETFMKIDRIKMTAGQKAAFTRKWRDAARKAHHTGKNAKTFTKYFLGKGGYKYMSLDSKKGYEYIGVVDLIAVKREKKDPDLLTIVLFQVKGGGARVSLNEINRLRKAARRAKIQWNVAEKPKKQVTFRNPLS